MIAHCNRVVLIGLASVVSENNFKIRYFLNRPRVFTDNEVWTSAVSCAKSVELLQVHNTARVLCEINIT